MVASLLRLLHSGPQDERLLPPMPRDAIKAFKRVLIRAGRMTTQWQRLDFYRNPQFGQQAVCRIPVKGELLTRLYLVATMPDIYTPQANAIATAQTLGKQFLGPRFGWTNSLGHALLGSVTLDIAGTRVEQLDGRLLEVLDEFTTPLEKVLTVNSLIKRAQNGFTQTTFGNEPTPTTVAVPLPFWFSRGDLGAALPIDSLYNDTVNLTVQFNSVNSVYYTASRTDASGTALWPLESSPFYVADLSGSLIQGLVPSGPVFASAIPGQRMPETFSLGDTYLLAEYVYLDRPEANRFRIGDLQLPIQQHMPIDPVDTRGFPYITIPFQLSNPIRNMYFFCQNRGATAFNAPFLATRDLSGCDVRYAPWWPDCSGLQAAYPGDLVPGFVYRDSEPVSAIELIYEGKYVKLSTDNPSFYRSILPSLEMKKSPWHNRYMYCLPFGMGAGYFPSSVPMGEGNWNRIQKKELTLWFTPNLGTVNQQTRLWVYCWAEIYNVLRIYGGRGTLLFSY